MKTKKLLLMLLTAALMITSAIPALSASVNSEITVKTRLYPMLDYDFVGKFNEGLAPAQKEKKVGFINSWGTRVIPLQYDAVYAFSEGLAAVRKSGKWGFIDKDGNIVIKFEYEAVGNFSDGLARIKKDGKWGFIDQTGEIVIQPIYLLVNDFKEGLAAVYNGTVFKRNLPKIKYIKTTNPERDFSVIYADNDGKWGFIDTTGKEVIPFEYDDIHGYYEDTTNKEYFGNGGLVEGLAAVCKNLKWGYIDRSGETVIPFKYDYADHFSDGLAIVRTRRNAKMEDIITEVVNGSFIFKNNRDEYYIDKTGKVIITVENSEPATGSVNRGFSVYNGINVSPFSNGLAKKQVNTSFSSSIESTFKFVDKSGKSVLEFSQEQYDNVYSFDTDGIAMVTIGKGFLPLCGCIDKTGKEVVPTIYNYVNDFNEGLSAVRQGNKWGILLIVDYGK